MRMDGEYINTAKEEAVTYIYIVSSGTSHVKPQKSLGHE
jgi:hypothetical protein